MYIVGYWHPGIFISRGPIPGFLGMISRDCAIKPTVAVYCLIFLLAERLLHYYDIPSWRRYRGGCDFTPGLSFTLFDSRSLHYVCAIMGDGARKYSPNDSYPTPTSTLQESTERILASHVPVDTSEADYELEKDTHVPFIARVMLRGFPSKYTGQDASQPWLIFWILQSFSILQVGLDPGNKQRLA